jgi:O-antigen/teichoic acid export membrane protein
MTVTSGPLPADPPAPPVVADVRDGRSRRPGRLELNALALMFTTVATAGLGLVFWAVAARLYPPVQVGIGSAMISTLTLLATLAQFNLGNVYARFLPAAGRASRRFVGTGYAAVVGFAVLLGLAFLALGLGDGIVSTPGDRWWFPVFVALLAIFGLQDFVLIALQAARFVPVENVIFSVLKIALLVLLADRMPHRGITVAWVIPAAAGVLVVSSVLYRRGLAHAGSSGARAGSLPGRRALGGIVAGEYLSGAVGVVVPMALPLIVVWKLGPEANAYFAMPWLIASSLNLLIWNVAAALLVEAASAPSAAPALVKRALRLSLLIGGAGALLELAGAPVILGVLGPGYAEHGCDLLRVMALAVPFNALLVSWTTLMRVHNRMLGLVTQQVLSGAAILTGTLLLIPGRSVTGAGIAYLLAQGGSGLIVARPLWRMVQPASGSH